MLENAHLELSEFQK